MSPSAQKVRSILRKAGFSNAQWVASGQVRGWGRWTTGYQVHSYNGKTRIEHRSSDYTIDDPARTAALDEYSAVIVAAGFQVFRSCNSVYVETPQ
jgi:hypothetical protein